MPQRETQVSSSLQLWKGIDQRTQPTLVQDGFFSQARGVYFGLGENAERISGKRIATKINGEFIVNIYQFEDIAIVQTRTNLYSVLVSELYVFDVEFAPGIPNVVALSEVHGDSVKITLPVFPSHTDSLSVERSLDLLIWTTVASLQTASAVVIDTGVLPATEYFYRAVAVNLQGYETRGASVSTTTPTTFTVDDETGDNVLDETSDPILSDP